MGNMSPSVLVQTPSLSPTLAEQGTPLPIPVKFASPPSDVHAHIDTYHKGKEVCFHTMENLVDDTAILGVASRVLDDKELLLVNTKEPPTFVDAKRDQQWRRAMLKEMKAIEEKG
jgi:hypothetical protein